MNIFQCYCVILEIKPVFETEGHHFVAASNAFKRGDKLIFKVADSMDMQRSVPSYDVASAIVTFPQIVRASVILQGARVFWQAPDVHLKTPPSYGIVLLIFDL